ncbi:MAG TPA: TonB-dependent receptor [Kofleriaceae bacterium]
MRVTKAYPWVLAVLCATGVAYAQPETDDKDAEPAKEPKEKGNGTLHVNVNEAAPASDATDDAMGTISGVVESPELDAPLAQATVTISGKKTQTVTTDDSGKFEVQVDPGDVKIKVDFPGFKSEEKAFNITAGTIAELTFSLTTEQELAETIVVVGSRTPRTNVDSPVPVDVVTSEEIAHSGRTETGRILHTLAASFISTPQTIADGSDHVDPAALRGLGPDQVLVLVNGKRRHKSALLHLNGTFGRGTVGTDLNAIATGSIKRIEILRDGAASQYGSDAIAGVINIVTKDVTDLLDISSETGITASRDGAQLKSSANYGYKIGEKGFLNLTGEFLQRQATDRSGRYTGTIYTDDKAADNDLIAMNGISRDDVSMKIGESSVTSGIGSYNMEVPVGDVAKFYSFGDIGYRRGAANGFYRFPKQLSQNVPQFYPNGFLPTIHPTMEDAAITVGIRRKGTTSVDASITHGRSSFLFNIENSVNASLGTNSPTTFDAGTVRSEETVADLDLQRKIDTKAVEALSLVFGTEMRVENYQIIAGDEASYAQGMSTYVDPATGTQNLSAPGAQVFPGFQPSNAVDRTRDNVGVYGGIESEVTKKISVDVGGRFENYSDFGQSLIGKVAARAQIAGPLSIRGGASTGFRAPSLQQLWFSNVSTQFVDQGMGLVATQVLTSNNKSPVTKAFGIPDLKEERSINASGGFTLKSGTNLSFSADGYFVRLKDRIVLTSQFNALQNQIVSDILSPFTGVTSAQFFANAVDTDTKGIDLVGDYSTALGDGQLAVTTSINFTKTDVIDVHIPKSLRDRFGVTGAEDCIKRTPDQLCTFFFGRLAQNRLEDSVPHQKATIAGRYAISGLAALVRANYYGKVFYKPDDPTNDEEFGAKVLFDVDLGYQFNKNLLVSIGADNLFNTFPDRQVKAANISDGRFIYSRNVSQFGQNGGFYYAKLELTFF